MAHPGGVLQNQGVIDCSHNQNSRNSYVTDNSIDNRVDNSIHATRYSNVRNSTITTYNTLGPPIGDKHEEMEDLLNWLSSLNFGAKHIDTFNQREHDTGQWFLEHPEVLKWFNGKNNILFCHGIPGAGKSTLVALTIEYLKERFKDDKTVAIAYVYCNYKEQSEHTAPNLMSNLLRQLAVAAAHTSSKALDDLRTLYKQHKEHSTRLLKVECIKMLNALLPVFTMVFIIVDALDEMLDIERDWFVRDLLNLAGIIGVSLLVTSRPIAHIKEKFHGTMQLEVLAWEADVVAYVNGQISNRHELATLVQKNPALGKEIIEGIVNKARGMFLLARFHLEAVMAAQTQKELRKLLQTLPDGIEDTYSDALTRIGTTKLASLAREVLMWITYTLRPLTIRELQHALAMKDPEINAPPDEESLIFEGTILAACAGLAIYDETSGFIRLVHYTAEEYFQKNGLQKLHPKPDVRIAASCMKYLSLDPRIYRLFFHDKTQYRFLSYAAENWGHHARRAYIYGNSESLHQQILTFLKQQEELFELRAVKSFWKKHLGWKLDAPPPLVASRFGLYNILNSLLGAYSPLCEWWQYALAYAVTGRHKSVVQLLVSEAVSVKLSGGAALVKAVGCGYEDIVMLLLEKGADMNVMSRGQTSLYVAAKGGHEGIVRLLLEKGADMEAGYYRRTPLLAAAEGGHEGIVRLLLEKGADMVKDGEKTPLLAAAEGGHEGIVRLLLEKGADMEVRDGEKTPLYAAAKDGHEGIVRLLLEKGADMEAKYYEGTPLNAAARGGHGGIVQLLLEKGARADMEAEYYEGTPLYAAVDGGHEGIVQLLLEKGADMEARYYERTPLYAAVDGGHKGIVRLLLEKGADMEAKYCGGTPLYAAAKGGHEGIVRLLLEKGADMEAKDDGSIPLFAAAGGGHEGIVRLLLEKGADIEAKYDGSIPLFAAAGGGHEGIVRLLLEKGADMEAMYDESILLFAAAGGGHEGIVQLLLEKGARADMEVKYYGRTPLYAAVDGGHEGIVRLLLEEGADMETKYYEDTPLYAGAKGGHEGAVRLLLGKSANMEVKYYGRTPLLAAAEGGHEGIVRLLLEKGADMEAKYYDDTPLYVTVKRKPGATVRLLLDKGANMEVKNCEKTSLYVAAKGGHEGIVRLLLEKGADMEAKYCGGTPLYVAAKGGHEGIVRLLLEKGADMEARYYRRTPLLAAVEGGHEGIVRLLLEKGADMEVRDGEITPLYAAANNGHGGIVRLLLEKGADMEAKYYEGTPLNAAARGGHEGVVQFLVEKGAKVPDEALYNAIAAGWAHEDTVGLLLEGVDITEAGGIALCLATENDFVGAVRLLLEKGVDLNSNGAIALSIAAYRGYERMVRLLLECGVDVNTIVVVTEYHHNRYMLPLGVYWPLSLAILGCRPHMVELLLEYGADANVALGAEAEGALLANWGTWDQARVIINQLLLEKGRKVPCIVSSTPQTPHHTTQAKRRRLDTEGQWLYTSESNVCDEDVDG